MTATAGFVDVKALAVEPVGVVDGGRMIIRGTQRLFGVSLTIAAIGLWLAPGASWESDVMLFKLILSITAVIAGLGLVSASAKPRAPEVEIDTIRREVRLVRRQRGTAAEILQNCAFADLAKAEYKGSTVRLWDASGAFLAEANLSDRTAFSSLIAGLRDVGKLA